MSQCSNLFSVDHFCLYSTTIPAFTPSGSYNSATRRDVLHLPLFLAAAPFVATPSALAEKMPKGFVPVKDQQDAYAFLYPFGWQEVSIDGEDVVFKDVIEPLESVSVNLVPTDKSDVKEYGDVKEVAFTLADKVLTNAAQEVTLVNATERQSAGRRYYDFEFLAKNKNYTRHAAASVTIANGKFYTLVTGANEKRWSRMQDKIRTVVNSFEVSDRY